MLKTKEKFTLAWIDAYLLNDNWKTIANIKKAFPVSNYSIAGDGWVDCEHCYTFKASSLKEVKKIVKNYIDTIGRVIDVFTVLDEKNNYILTEENI